MWKEFTVQSLHSVQQGASGSNEGIVSKTFSEETQAPIYMIYAS